MDKETFMKRIVIKVDPRNKKVTLEIVIDAVGYQSSFPTAEWTVKRKMEAAEGMWELYAATLPVKTGDPL